MVGALTTAAVETLSPHSPLPVCSVDVVTDVARFIALESEWNDAVEALQTFSSEEKIKFFSLWGERGDVNELVRAVETHPDWMSHAWRAMAKYHASRNDFRSALELVRRFGETPPLPEAATQRNGVYAE